MEWAIEFVPSTDRNNVKYIRQTVEAKLKAETGMYGDAARVLWELLIDVRHARMREWECITMVHMGKVYRVLRWGIAVKLFEDAAALAEEIDFPLARMMALAELGEMRCHWGEFEKSLDLFATALDLVAPDDLASRRTILLDTAVALEGLDRLDRCRELIREVLEIDRKIGASEVDEDRAHLQRIEAALDRAGRKQMPPVASR